MQCAVDKPKKRKLDPDDELASLSKALGHPARLRLLRILIEKGECISGDLADQLPLAPSTISEHLRILKSVGLIQGSIDGPRRCYCVHEPTLKRLQALVAGFG
jgi:ArsR family transcriptional regulator, arsenate/arsenite/antimonite-responsive transcriptional repressor